MEAGNLCFNLRVNNFNFMKCNSYTRVKSVIILFYSIFLFYSIGVFIPVCVHEGADQILAMVLAIRVRITLKKRLLIFNKR